MVMGSVELIIIDSFISLIVSAVKSIIGILLTPVILLFLLILPGLKIILALKTEYLDEVSAEAEAARLGVPDMGAGYYLHKKLREKLATERRKGDKK
jgi:uncharacterized membrane protein